MPHFPPRRPATTRRRHAALWLAALLAAANLSAQEETDPAPDDSTVMLDPLVVDGDLESDNHDPTGLDRDDVELSESPFSNELLSDPAFDEMPLGELDSELDSLLVARADAAEVAAGSETVQLRGFPTPSRRNGFTQAGIPEIINSAGSQLVIGSLVPVVGRAAPGGIRNYRVARPRGKVARQLEAHVGTNDAWRTRATSTGVVAPKKSWYLVSAGWSGREGPQTFSEIEQHNLGASLAIRHSRSTSTLWTIDAIQVRGNPAPGVPEYRLVSGGPVVGRYLPLAHFHTYGPNASIRRQAVSFGFQLESQLTPDLALSSATQFFGRNSEQDRFTTGQYVLATGRFSGTREPTHRELEDRGFAHQTDLTRRFRAFGADHKLLVGVELSGSVSSDENRGLTPADRLALLPADVRSFDPYSPNYYRPAYSPETYRRVITDRENHLGYAAGVASLRSAFNRGRTVLTVGVRHDLAEVEVDDRRPTTPARLAHSEKSLSNTSFHAGLNQRVGRSLLVFATTSSAVQPSTRVDSRTGEIQDNASTRGVDLGFRAQLLDRRLAFGAMAYSYNNANIVRRNPLYNDPVADADQSQPQLVTSGEEEFRGITTQVGWRPAPGWTWTARATWTDAITISSPDLPEEEGRRITHVPRFSGATGLRRSFSTGPLKGLSVGGTVTRIGSTIQSYTRPGRERLDYPGYTVANLHSSYTWKSGKVTHTVSASVANLFDTDLLEKIARVGAERSLTVGWRVAF